MGYTHYFDQKADVGFEDWNYIKTDLFITLDAINKLVLENGAIQGIDELPLVNDWSARIRIKKHIYMILKQKGVEHIAFNGNEYKGLAAQTFMLSQSNDNHILNRCKTYRQPYDLLVIATLLIVNHHAPECFDIRSDGDVEWLPVQKWLSKLLVSKYKLPKKVALEIKNVKV